MAGTAQAPPQRSTREQPMFGGTLSSTSPRTHQAAPGSEEATRQRAASVKAYACMGMLLRRAPEAIRDGRKGRQAGVISLKQALRGRLQSAELNTDADWREVLVE